MKITCKLSTLMGENRYNIQDVHDKTGINRGTIANLYHDRLKRVDFEVLAKLCVLFDCLPGDLLVCCEDKPE